MKKIVVKNNLLEKNIDSKYLLLFFPLFIIIGKVVRWTIMVDTLVNMSKGWGYVSTIINGSNIPFELFSAEDALAGDNGGTNNMFLLYRLIRLLFLNIPDDFYEFEIAITIFLGIILFILFTKMKKTITISEFIFLGISIIVLSVYCFTLAKEPMQMLYFYLLFWVLYTNRIPEKWKLVAAVSVIILSAATFRVYYVIFLVFAFPFIFFMRKYKEKEMTVCNVIVLFVKMCSIYLAMMLILMVVLGSLYTRLAESLLFASDATSSANTYIENLVTNSTGNVFLVFIEYSLVVLRLLFPIELISLGIKYWPYIIYQILMTFSMIKAVKNYNKSTTLQRVATAFFVAFVFGSATFEVDFGAWIRHGAVTLPLILLMTGTIENKSEKSEVEICEY